MFLNPKLFEIKKFFIMRNVEVKKPAFNVLERGDHCPIFASPKNINLELRASRIGGQEGGRDLSRHHQSRSRSKISVLKKKNIFNKRGLPGAARDYFTIHL